LLFVVIVNAKIKLLAFKFLQELGAVYKCEYVR